MESEKRWAKDQKTSNESYTFEKEGSKFNCLNYRIGNQTSYTGRGFRNFIFNKCKVERLGWASAIKN
ncbi:unnamed protein product [Parnassius mnemosyne]|uniref:Uncharacterized protein n=1 Tax=Parnassius mnemosyne TaxID=213953 RepID=A0AAV1LNN2_9NEOP